MKVLVDGRILGYFGPGEYLKNLIINLAHLDHKNNYIVLIKRKTPVPFKQDNFHFFEVPSFVGPYSPWEQLLIPHLIKRLKPDLAYFPNFNIPLKKLCPYVVTIHDLIYLLYPKDSPSYLSFCYARFMLKYAAQKADVVITDSEHSRKDLIRYLNIPEDKAFNVSGAAGDRFMPLDKPHARTRVRERYKIKKAFILYVGNHHCHKNILALIDAYSHLKDRTHYNLVIAGEDSWRTRGLKRDVERRNLKGDVIFTGFIPSEDLPLVYNAATCFVFPSLYEGFGLPPLEAMACGTPVIASTRASLPEVLGDAAIFIDPLKPGDLNQAMEKVLGTPDLRRELRERGPKQAGSFSWISTAESLLEMFKKAKLKHLGQKKHLRICLVSNEYPPETGWGGVGTYTYNLAQSLVELGHNVHVISRAIEKEGIYLDNGVYVHRIFNQSIRIPVFPHFFKLTYERITRALAVSKKVRQLEKKSKFDIIEAPEWGSEALFCPKRKLVTRLHTPLWLADRLNNTRPTIDSHIANFLEKWQCRKSISLNANSHSLAKEIRSAWKVGEIKVTYYPFILPREGERVKEEDYILYFGQLSVRKGILVLAEALKKVMSEFPNIEMVFAGQDLPFKKGTMSNCLEDLLGDYMDRIRFLGHLSRENLYSVIRKARIVVLPSLWESFGYTCLEAISLGKVVIATYGNGFEEIIEGDGKNGFLVEPGDPLALAQKIKLCLNNTNLNGIKQKARERAKFFDAKKIALEMSDYYEGLLSKSAHKEETLYGKEAFSRL